MQSRDLVNFIYIDDLSFCEWDPFFCPITHGLHLSYQSSMHHFSPQLLLTSSPSWKAPQLLRLPTLFDQIFQFYRQRHCRTCDSQPKDPSLCLVCGQLVCFKERCCQVQNVFECVQASELCRHILLTLEVTNDNFHGVHRLELYILAF